MDKIEKDRKEETENLEVDDSADNPITDSESRASETETDAQATPDSAPDHEEADGSVVENEPEAEEGDLPSSANEEESEEEAEPEDPPSDSREPLPENEGEENYEGEDKKEDDKPERTPPLYVYSYIFLCLVTVLSLSFFTFKLYRTSKLPPQNQGLQADISDPDALNLRAPLPPEIEGLKQTLPSTQYPQGMLEKYETLYALNNDLVGWLRIENTSIDTPITQRPNNTYYLKTDFYHKYTNYGNAFLDYRDGLEPLSQNTVIYGHSGRNETQVFSVLFNYLDYDFYINNPIIEFGTLYKDYKWKIFSVYISTVEKKDDKGYFFYYISPSIKAEKFPGFIDQIQQYSRFYTQLDLDPNDKILQLSTCVYKNDLPGRSINSRLVVAAKLMKEGESEDVDPKLVFDNPNFRRPQAWYNYHGIKNPYAGRANWKR